MAFVKVRKQFNDLANENEYTVINTDMICSIQDYVSGVYQVELANQVCVLLDGEEAQKVFEAIGVSLP